MKPLPQATRLAARIIGPLFLIAGALLITQSGRMLAVIDAVLENEGLFVTSAFLSIMVGLSIMALHPYWRGLTSGFISLLGLVAIARGAVVLFAPDVARRLVLLAISAPNSMPIGGCVIAIIGLLLLIVSFLSPPSEDLGLI